VSSAITPATRLEHDPRARIDRRGLGPLPAPCAHRGRGRLAAFVLLGLLLWLTGGIDPHRQFFLSYLVAYNYWLGGALGCLVFLMLQYVTGAPGV